jgi:hypothetical protein
MRGPRSLARALVAAVGIIFCICAGVACNIRFPEKSNASSTSSGSRYQLTKDKDGRVLRLDTVTGDVTVAEPAPAAPSRQRPNSAVAAPANVPEPAPTPPVAEVVASEPPRPLPVAADPAPRAQVRPPAEIVAAPSRAENNVCAREDFIRNVATLADVPVYIRPRPTEKPLATLTNGVALMVIERASDWVLVRFQDFRFGPRVGYAHCSQLRALGIDAVENAAEGNTAPIRSADAR